MFEGRYEILARLGEGGFGGVYKAVQRTTGQVVALELMRMPRQGDVPRLEKRVARFMRETHLCAQLHHPNIVQLIDSGRVEGGALYTVFSFVPGDTLAGVRGSSAIVGGAFFRWSTGLNTLADTSYVSSTAITPSGLSLPGITSLSCPALS